VIDTLARDLAALHTAHTAGAWHPTKYETALAADLARAHWTGPLLRAALRRDDIAQGTGALAGVLESAAAVLEDPHHTDRPDTSEVLVRLRTLVDHLAHGEDHAPQPSEADVTGRPGWA